MNAFAVRTLAADHITPIRAYAALRSRSAGRSSFLLESLSTSNGVGPYTIMGYRPRSEALYPPGGDVLGAMKSDLEARFVHSELAVRMTHAMVGYIAYEALAREGGIEPREDEPALARFVQQATVVAFDPAGRTLTIAAPSENAIDRCAWEMTHGPEMDAIRLDAVGALPESVDAACDDAAFTELAERARAQSGGASHLPIARSFVVPMRNSDAFDVYRAMRSISAGHRCFIDFADSPMAPGFALAALANDPLVRSSSEPDVLASIRAAIGTRRGGGTVDRIVREIEPQARGAHGGALGFIGGGEELDLAIAFATVVAADGQYQITSQVDVADKSSTGTAAERARTSAEPLLAAVRVAHDLQVGREAAARRKAEADRASKGNG